MTRVFRILLTATFLFNLGLACGCDGSNSAARKQVPSKQEQEQFQNTMKDVMSKRAAPGAPKEDKGDKGDKK